MKKLVKRGFEWFVHESIEGGIIYDYRKQVKNNSLDPKGKGENKNV